MLVKIAAAITALLLFISAVVIVHHYESVIRSNEERVAADETAFAALATAVVTSVPTAQPSKEVPLLGDFVISPLSSYEVMCVADPSEWEWIQKSEFLLQIRDLFSGKLVNIHFNWINEGKGGITVTVSVEVGPTERKILVSGQMNVNDFLVELGDSRTFTPLIKLVGIDPDKGIQIAPINSDRICQHRRV